MAKDRSTTVGSLADLNKLTSTEPVDVIQKEIDAMVKDQEDHLVELKATRYGPVECTAADGTVSEKFGRKSCAVINVEVPIPSLGLKLQAAIYGNLETKAEGTTIKFTGYIPPKLIKFTDADAKERLLAHIEVGASQWIGYDKATTAAEARLMGQTNKIAGQLARPNLVRRVVTVAAAAVPAA